MTKAIKLSGLLALALAFAAAGCGGDDEEATTGTSGATGAAGPVETTTEFISAADAICRETASDPQAASAAFDEADRLAQDLGLKVCGG